MNETQGKQERYRDFGDSCSGVYPPEEFEGLWIEHWPSGQLKFRGYYKRYHRRVGQHLSFWENGVLQEVSFWDEGWVCGTVLWFRKNGSKESEKDYGVYGGRTRSWVERWYGSENELWRVVVWNENQIVAEWMDPQVRKISDEIGVDKIVNDAVRRIYPEE